MSHNTYMDHAMNDYTNSIKNIRSSSSSSGGGDGGITDDDQAMMMTMISGSTTATPAGADHDYQEDEDQALTDLRRGPWTVEEDLILINYIANHGEGRWNSLARCAGLKRTGKSCRLRWLNYLRPDVRRGNITLEEQLLILELHSRWGNRWSKIAQYLPGRTDNEIKNYWRTRVQKHAKQLKCDVNSKQFKDTMRYLWMPRLVERIQAAAATAATNPPAKSNGAGAHAPAAASENMTTYAPHLLQSSAAGSEHFMSDVPTATTTAPPPPPPTLTAAKTTPHHHQLSVNSNITPENSGGSTSTDHDSSSFGTQVGVGLSLADHLSSDFTVPALTPAPNAIGAADHYYSSFHNYLHNDGSSNNNINNNHHDYYSVNHNYNREDYSAGGGGGGAYASIVDSLTSPATSCANYLVNQHHQGSAAGFEEYYVPAASVAAGTAASMFHQNVDSNGAAAAAPPPSTSYNNNINMSTGTSTSEWYVGGRGSCGSGGDAYDSFWNVDEDLFLLQQQFNVV